jgi:hypothetical protein
MLTEAGVAGYTIVQKPQAMLLKVLPQLGLVSVSVAGELEKERLVMASVGQVENAALGPPPIAPLTWAHLSAA